MLLNKTKFYIIFVISAVVLMDRAFADSNKAKPLCTRPNESYNVCGHACSLTCENYKTPPACDAKCLPELAGCYCKDPYVKNKNGDCVQKEQCEDTSRICKHANERYHSCSNGCELTCANYKVAGICNPVCLPEKAGCYCDYGRYVRGKNGDCILPEQCETQNCSRPHEKYLSCSNGCQTTCENYENPPNCTMQCTTKFAGCYCEHPYVRNGNGDCVLTTQCKPKVVEPQQPYCKGSNEVYNPKGELCPRICATRGAMIKCKAGTQPGCFCAPGFLRNSKNKCVLESNCS